MAHIVKVQDGKIVYAAADPAYIVDFDVVGQMNVSKNLNVGDDLLAGGVITTPDGADLLLETGTGGNLKLQPSGSILLNNISWPSSGITPTPGMFLGVQSLNNLEFYAFILGSVSSNNATDTELNALYPAAGPGQSAIGPETVYQSLGSGNWRRLGGVDDSTVPYYIPEDEVYIVRNNKQALYHMSIEIDGSLEIDGFLLEV